MIGTRDTLTANTVILRDTAFVGVGIERKFYYTIFLCHAVRDLPWKSVHVDALEFVPFFFVCLLSLCGGGDFENY